MPWSDGFQASNRSNEQVWQRTRDTTSDTLHAPILEASRNKSCSTIDGASDAGNDAPGETEPDAASNAPALGEAEPDAASDAPAPGEAEPSALHLGAAPDDDASAPRSSRMHWDQVPLPLLLCLLWLGLTQQPKR